ncbi:DUF1990 family protein [Pseudonocardia sp. NPDC049635]|uniref:DUF1990 family protein n=1 Tax=Pseudonocardia sp. NPDC049635 TaxID=3155506 RepID=UPI0033FF020E
MKPLRLPFAFDPRFLPVLAPLGVTETSGARVELDEHRLLVRFGAWSVSTPVRNLAGAQLAGPFSAPKVIGPHLSLADRGVTFGTNTRRGVCIRFHRPVPGLEPLGLLRHPGVTVTVRDPELLAAAVEEHAERTRRTTNRRADPTPQPGRVRRACAIMRYPAGLALSTARYLRCSRRVRRTEEVGDATDLPPALPREALDAHLKVIDEGAGPLLHRTFRVRIRDADLGAEALMDRICADLDRAAPSEVTSFRKLRGRLGELRPGDEYVVRMPAPWSGPVRVLRRDRTSFRFATLADHLEAGQIEFAAHDVEGGLEFGIEAWCRPGSRAAAVVLDTIGVGKEIQLHMWTQFCVAACEVAGGRMDGPIRVHTRRCGWPAPERPGPSAGGNTPA